MLRHRFLPYMLLALLVLLVLAACDQATTQPGPPPPGGPVTLRKVVDGLVRPVTITNAGDDRLFVVERPGRIRIVEGGELLATPFLDISTLVTEEGERGLLGLAFPPDYANSGRFYVDYTDTGGDTIVARYLVSSADANSADPDSGVELLRIVRPTASHDGGQLAFGPDGYLYVSSGDGAEGGLAATTAGGLLGRIMRLDVSGPGAYAVPSSNPFSGTPGAELTWAYGLRNPWRFSFDRQTGDLYIADVGESSYEEIDFQPAASSGGQNYGWNVMEGASCYQAATCSTAGLTLPVLTYAHGTDTGHSITGGYVYRGSAIPSLAGRYVFGDYVSGNVWTTAAPDWRRATLLTGTGMKITTFGEDSSGELYLADYAGGAIYRLVQ